MTPVMSVVLVTDAMERVEGVIATLRLQTIADRMELVLALPEGMDPPPGLDEGFLSTRLVPVADPFEIPDARARCVRAAAAPIVTLCETHCLHEPECSERLLEGFADPEVAVVGSRVLCANPQTTLAQAAHLMDYGPWAQGPPGARAELPAHNVAFRRTFLLELGDDLANALDSNAGLGDRTRLAGRTMLFEPTARIQHLNVSRAWPWLKERVYNGRAYAAQVSGGWPWPRRLAYALAWPLIPVVRFVRLAPVARAAGVSSRSMPTLVLALVLASAGEAVGFITGPGGALRLRHRVEIEKGHHLKAGEATAALDRVVALHGTA